MRTISTIGFILISLCTPVIAQTNSCDSNNSDSIGVSALPISNEGIKWGYTADTFGLIREVQIIGKEERNIMKMDDPPPLDALFDCLSDTNKWKVAHVLISFRYLGRSHATRDKWNELNPDNSVNETAEMKKIQTYWNGKRDEGELEKVVPTIPEGMLNRAFGIKESAESKAAKKEKMESKNRQWAMNQFGGEVPPLEVLLDSLCDTNKWREAHVLLTVKYEPSKYTVNDGEGLFTTDAFEMKKRQEYWQDKNQRGELK